MRRGKHVYCEKPMAGSYIDAETMYETAQELGRRAFGSTAVSSHLLSDIRRRAERHRLNIRSQQDALPFRRR